MTENKNDVLRLKGSCWSNVPIEVLGCKVELGWEKFLGLGGVFWNSYCQAIMLLIFHVLSSIPGTHTGTRKPTSETYPITHMHHENICTCTHINLTIRLHAHTK